MHPASSTFYQMLNTGLDLFMGRYSSLSELCSFTRRTTGGKLTSREKVNV